MSDNSTVHYTAKDAFGNVYAAGVASGGGGGGGGSYPITITPGSTSGNVQGGWTTNITWPPPNMLPGMEMYMSPNQATLTPELVDALVDKIVTLQKPGEKVIICVDDDVTDQQCKELQELLNERCINKGVIIRGARAGTGFKGNVLLPTTEDERVDVLARIGEIWAQRPDLKLCELLEWWNGMKMDDEDFATATEVYFQKITNGVYGKP